MPEDTSLGNLLETAYTKAEKNIILIAPFIKQRALKRLLAHPRKAEKLVVVARWRPEDIARGSSDIEVFNILHSMENSDLRIHGLLHAKYYRFDDEIFIGSANLTGAGLGWSSPSNVETLLPLPNDMHEALRAMEQEILAQSSPVTEEIAEAIAEAAAKITERPEILIYSESDSRESVWLPSCIRPEEMFSVMAGGDAPITKLTKDAALSDIATLGLFTCASEKEFKAMVYSRLASQKIFVDITELVRSGKLTDGDATAFLDANYKDHITIPTDEDEQWKILKAWIRYFMSEHFHIVPVEEAIEIGGVIDDNSN